MSQNKIKSRAEEILFLSEDISISSLGGKDVALSLEQLEQLVDEKIV